MPNINHRRAIDLLLSSIYQNHESGYRHAFMFGPPGSPMWQHSRGTEILYDRGTLVEACLFVRSNGPAFLKFHAVEAIRSMLTNFVSDHFWHIDNEMFLQKFEGSLLDKLSDETKEALAEALGASKIFDPDNATSLFPLVPIRVDKEFEGDNFLLSSCSSLTSQQLGHPDYEKFDPSHFPPIADASGLKESPTSWLCIHSPTVDAARKMKRAILGAIALAPRIEYRHQFTGRHVFGGICTFSHEGTSYSYGDAHTPALSEDIIIDAADHAWLKVIDDKLDAADKSTRKQLFALEYFFRSWSQSPSERFATLCMSLDAIFGDSNQATQSVVDHVKSTMSADIPDDRIRLLMKLRASVIHGGAPDVYDSSKYARYYKSFGADPIRDLDLVVAECLRRTIFGEAFRVQYNPHAELIAKLQKEGRYPTSVEDGSIFIEST